MRRKGGMVDVGMEWQRRRWCVLVGEGGGYKWYAPGWTLTKLEVVVVNIVFFCHSVNLFFSGTKRSKSLTLNVGVFDRVAHLYPRASP